MNATAIRRIIKSTVHVQMAIPPSYEYAGIGSGCIIKYKNKEIFLSVAHVTNKNAQTCLVTDDPKNLKKPSQGMKLFGLAFLNYLEQYDLMKYEQQLAQLQNETIKDEDVDFGTIDFSFAVLEKSVDLFQRPITIGNFQLRAGRKQIIDTNLEDIPLNKREYGFFGRIKPLLVKGTRIKDTLELQETLVTGLRFEQNVGNYYKFKLPKPIQSEKDFKGTSGAPIMDANGRVVSLVTHGYTGGFYIYGIALSKFKAGVDATLLAEGYNLNS